MKILALKILSCSIIQCTTAFGVVWRKTNFFFTVGPANTSPIITFQPSGFGRNTVGQRQDVICSIFVPPDVDPDTVEFGWLNEDDIITNDSRVTIIESPNDSANNSSNVSISVITTVIRFDPLFEDDEGIYSCYLIVNESEISTSIQLEDFRSM